MEQELREALRRKPAPEGFAARVQALLPERRPFVARWAVAATVTIVMVSGTFTWREIEQRRGEQAAQQTLDALRLVSEKVNFARNRVLKVSHGVHE